MLRGTVSPAHLRALRGYGFSIGSIGLATLLAWLLLPWFTLVNIVMIFVAAVVGVAFFTGRGPSVLASLLASLCFGFFYIPPRFVFGAEETQYLLTLLVMLGLSVLISGLTARWREKALEAASKQREQAALYRYTRALAAESRPAAVAASVAGHLAESWGGPVQLFLPDAAHRLVSAVGADPATLALADAVWRDGQPRGLDGDSGPLAEPLRGVSGPAAVAVFMAPERARLREGRELLEAMLTSGALALERARLSEEAEAARMHAESERLRNSLLSAVSHDLRTPLAVIVGAASSLVDDSVSLTPKARAELTRVVMDEAGRMRALMENLLDMARLEAGPVTLQVEWQAFEEVLGAVLKATRPRLGGRTLRVEVPNDMALIRFDSALIERVLANLLENAVKYTPEQANILLRAVEEPGGLRVCVLDDGPGLGEHTERVFNKFWRANPEGPSPGVGLGLSICRSIVEAHGGRMWAENRPDGGACFCFTLPHGDGSPPAALPLEAV